ncbi:hypothetical protein [uncultured Sphingomonas sp.]|uniref:hypothetical protein n=1 Tax=uncultured Sphingomonas sp. TaxID=158754 RepID=UPI0035CB36AB
METLVEWQGYLLLVLTVIVGVGTAALLVLWQEKGQPDFDHIAVAMSMFQTLFGIAAIGGFWALRGATREKAEEVAEAEVRKIAPSLILGHVQENLQTFRNEAPISNTDLDDMVDAIGGKEDGDGK